MTANLIVKVIDFLVTWLEIQAKNSKIAHKKNK